MDANQVRDNQRFIVWFTDILFLYYITALYLITYFILVSNITALRTIPLIGFSVQSQVTNTASGKSLIKVSLIKVSWYT